MITFIIFITLSLGCAFAAGGWLYYRHRSRVLEQVIELLRRRGNSDLVPLPRSVAIAHTHQIEVYLRIATCPRDPYLLVQELGPGWMGFMLDYLHRLGCAEGESSWVSCDHIGRARLLGQALQRYDALYAGAPSSAS